MSEPRTYDYGTHECIDRTFLVMEMFSYVSEHPQIVRDPVWNEMAVKAHNALWALYQSIGADMELPGGPLENTGSHAPKA